MDLFSNTAIKNLFRSSHLFRWFASFCIELGLNDICHWWRVSRAKCNTSSYSSKTSVSRKGHQSSLKHGLRSGNLHAYIEVSLPAGARIGLFRPNPAISVRLLFVSKSSKRESIMCAHKPAHLLSYI